MPNTLWSLTQSQNYIFLITDLVPTFTLNFTFKISLTLSQFSLSPKKIYPHTRKCLHFEDILSLVPLEFVNTTLSYQIHYLQCTGNIPSFIRIGEKLRVRERGRSIFSEPLKPAPTKEKSVLLQRESVPLMAYPAHINKDGSLTSMSALPLLKSQYSGVMMGAMTSQITSVSIVYSTVCSGKDQRQHQRSASLAFVRGIHRWPVNSPHKKPVTRNMFPFNDVIMHKDRKMHIGQVSQGAWMSNNIPENTVGYNYQSLLYISMIAALAGNALPYDNNEVDQ